jgi:hypothetical protein
VEKRPNLDTREPEKIGEGVLAKPEAEPARVPLKCPRILTLQEWIDLSA